MEKSSFNFRNIMMNIGKYCITILSNMWADFKNAFLDIKENKDTYIIMSLFSAFLLFCAMLFQTEINNFFGVISEYLSSLGETKLVAIAVGVVLLIIVLCVNNLKIGDFELSLNEVFEFAFEVLIYITSGAILILLCVFFSNQGFLEKINYLISSPFIALLLFCLVLIFGSSVIKNNITYTKKVNETSLDFEDIYKKTEKFDNTDSFIIKEIDVDYDLLDSDYIIIPLKNDLINIASEQSTVIAVEGTWGSGKSTIINNVTKQLSKEAVNAHTKKLKAIKKNHKGKESKQERALINAEIKTYKKIKVIKTFDPWNYNSEETMLRGILNELLTGIGYENNYRLINSIIEATIADITPSNLVNTLVKSIGSSSDTISILKTKVAKKIDHANKKIVFVIDNIDRLDKENTLFLFKCLATILDFKNVIYLVSYDPQRINTYFDKDDINGEYYKKIVNKKYSVKPAREETLSEIINTCCDNLFRKYSTSGQEEISVAVGELKSYIKDLRDLKQFINSVLCPVIRQKTKLNKRDLVLWQYLNVFHSDVYQDIIYKGVELVENTTSKNQCIEKHPELMSVLELLLNKNHIKNKKNEAYMSNAKHFEDYITFRIGTDTKHHAIAKNYCDKLSKCSTYEDTELIVSKLISEKNFEWIYRKMNILELNSEVKTFMLKAFYKLIKEDLTKYELIGVISNLKNFLPQMEEEQELKRLYAEYKAGLPQKSTV